MTGFRIRDRQYTATNYDLVYSPTWKRVVDGEITNRPGRFYVAPPGQWVDSVDAAISLWRDGSTAGE